MTKQELLQTIEILFWENSFSDLSMDQIAKKLEMKKPSLYYHFPSKEAMFLEVLEFSYKKYHEFITSHFSHFEEAEQKMGRDMAERKMISALILFSLEKKNLFAIVSQKGYCQLAEAHAYIREKTEEIQNILSQMSKNTFSWNENQTFLFLTLTDSLAKRCSLDQCKHKNMEKIVEEVRKLFF